MRADGIVFLRPVVADQLRLGHLDLDQAGEDALTQVQAAAVGYRIAVGPIAGRKTFRLHTPGAAIKALEPAKPFTAAPDGFSINAVGICEARQP